MAFSTLIIRKIRTTAASLHTRAFAHLPIVLHCYDVIIFLGRKVAHVENNGLGRWLNANPYGQSVIRIFRIIFLYRYGSGSVILLRPKIGLAPKKHDVISMPRQQYTNTKHIPIESYHLVVSIMPRHMDPKKIFGQNLCCREVKIDKISGGDLPYFSLKCDNLP